MDGHVLHGALVLDYEMSFKKEGEDYSLEEEENGDLESLKSDYDDDGDYDNNPITDKGSGTLLFSTNDAEDGERLGSILVAFMTCSGCSKTI